MPLGSLNRPKEIDCLSFETSALSNNTCRHYLKGGQCALEQIVVCTEWAKRFPQEAAAKLAALTTLPSGSRSNTPSPSPNAETANPPRRQLALLPGMPPEPPTPANARAQRATQHASSAQQQNAPGAHHGPLSTAPKAPIELVTAADAADLAQRGYEMRLEGLDLGQDVWLVPTLTSADRLELTYSQAGTLANIVAAFPGAKVRTIRNAAPQRSTATTNGSRAAG